MRGRKKEIRKVNTKVSAYILDQGYGYPKQALDNANIICYDRKIYLPKTLRRHVLDWYRLYINHPGGSRLAKKIRWIWYWKGLVTKQELYTKTCKICQKFKNRNSIYGCIPPDNIEELKPWDRAHVNLICPYIKYTRQQKLGSAIIKNNISLICMPIIDPAMGWFEIYRIQDSL